MTQADLGRLLGVKQARIADIENDPGSISVAQMHKLLAALGAQLVLRDTGSGWSVAMKEAAATASPTPPRTRQPSGSKPAAAKKRAGIW